MPVYFDKQSFDHIFYEKDIGGKNEFFSKRRAKKMLFIKAVLSGKLSIEIMDQPDRGTFAIFCVDLDCVIYLRSRVGTGRLQVCTFFDFGEKRTKHYERQKKKCIPITLQEIKNKL